MTTIDTLIPRHHAYGNWFSTIWTLALGITIKNFILSGKQTLDYFPPQFDTPILNMRPVRIQPFQTFLFRPIRSKSPNIISIPDNLVFPTHTVPPQRISIKVTNQRVWLKLVDRPLGSSGPRPLSLGLIRVGSRTTAMRGVSLADLPGLFDLDWNCANNTHDDSPINYFVQSKRYG